jgi:hypothetical protein
MQEERRKNAEVQFEKRCVNVFTSKDIKERAEVMFLRKNTLFLTHNRVEQISK